MLRCNLNSGGSGGRNGSTYEATRDMLLVREMEMSFMTYEVLTRGATTGKLLLAA